MLFNSMKFLIFFPVVVMVYFIIPNRAKNIWLLISSYFFYMCWNIKYVFLLISSTLITYISGILIEKTKKIREGARLELSCKKIILVLCITLNLLILFYYKYFNFALDILEQLLKPFNIETEIPVFDIILPVGISFYTFQALGYIIDVYNGKIYAEKNFLCYSLFVSFFPQLVAGPIERSKNLLKQLQTPKSFNADMVKEGLLLMMWGYFLKLVIADRCALLVNIVYGDYNSYYGLQLIIANILFAFQIYCDFMGYSVIAKGAARVMGYKLMDNFLQPYMAQSVKEFWQRWHISLSSWFRDYVYIPLGGNRKTKIIKYRNILITFLVSGLWHGANITFVFWGILHGFYQIFEEILMPFFQKFYKAIHINTLKIQWKVLRVIKTFILVDIAWIFFRADTFSSAVVILKNSFNFSGTKQILSNGLYQLEPNTLLQMLILVPSLIILLVYSIIKEKTGQYVMEWLLNKNIIVQFIIYWGAVMFITFSLDITGQEFIYFQF